MCTNGMQMRYDVQGCGAHVTRYLNMVWHTIPCPRSCPPPQLARQVTAAAFSAVLGKSGNPTVGKASMAAATDASPAAVNSQGDLVVSWLQRTWGENMGGEHGGRARVKFAPTRLSSTQ